MSDASMLLIIVMTVVLVGGSIAAVGRARRAARSAGTDDLTSRADTHRFLAENWAMVERTARESGMSEDEIARVRANVLG